MSSAWGSDETQYFYALTPDRVLDAVEKSLGVRCTGRSMAHASMENRVYELQLDLEEGRPKHEQNIIVKFYRPGRWTAEQILEEHRFLKALAADEIPVVAPLTFVDGSTLHRLADASIYYSVFPKVGGRSPQELTGEDLERIGRLLARMHNVGAQQKVEHRLTLSPQLYLDKNLSFLLEQKLIPESLRAQFQAWADRVRPRMEADFLGIPLLQIHGDCHLGNLLQFREGFFWVDFDDSVRGPAVQDIWLLLPGRDNYAREMLERLISAYEMMRPFPRESLRLIESLRALRMIHFAAWIGHRRDDPAFQRAFPDYGTDRYWQQLWQDLREQEEYILHTPFWTNSQASWDDA